MSDRTGGFESFSVALDESTDSSDTAQSAIFIRGVDKEFAVTEELLALQPLKETTTGEDIFNEVQRVFKSFGLPYHSISLIWSEYECSEYVLHTFVNTDLSDRNSKNC